MVVNLPESRFADSYPSAQVPNLSTGFRPKPTPPRNPATLIHLGLLPSCDVEETRTELQPEHA